MGLCDAAMQGLSAERREQVASAGRERGLGRCASIQGVVEEVGRDAAKKTIDKALFLERMRAGNEEAAINLLWWNWSGPVPKEPSVKHREEAGQLLFGPPATANVRSAIANVRCGPHPCLATKVLRAGCLRCGSRACLRR